MKQEGKRSKKENLQLKTQEKTLIAEEARIEAEEEERARLMDE